MKKPTLEQYLDYRRQFAVTRETAVAALDWAEPLARQALGIHAQRDQMELGERLPVYPVLTTAVNNGGWGELMPVWFKPYERPLPLYILDNWAMLALLWRRWLGDVGPAYNVDNLLKIFVGSGVLIPFLPQVQNGGHFLRQGAFTILLAILWLEPEARADFIAWNTAAARRFAREHRLPGQPDLAGYLGQIEFEAFFVAEGSKIGGEEQIAAFLADESRFQAYAALFGGLSFSLAALFDWYGPDWEAWIYQKVNLDYRLARFGLEAWANWLGVPYVEPPPDGEMSKLFRAD